MKSDPKDCLYCQNNETLHNLMIEIAQLVCHVSSFLRNKLIAGAALWLTKTMSMT